MPKRNSLSLLTTLALTLAIIGLDGCGTPASAQESDETSHIGRNYSAGPVIWSGLGRGFLGVSVVPMTEELRTHFGVPEDRGVLVSRVDEDSPAQAAGILVGDILSTLDGESIESPVRLSRLVRRKEEGDRVTIELYRNGGLESLPVEMAERDRRVIDLGDYDFMPGFAELPSIEIPDGDVVLGRPGMHLGMNEETREALREAMRELGERIGSEEWKEKIERLKELDLGAIQNRMRKMEQRLEELERELASESRKKL